MKDLFSSRSLVIKIIFVVIGSLFFLRLFYLQVLSSEFAQQANNNAIKQRRVEPARGLIYDRNGKILVYNAPIYDIFVNPAQAKNKTIDTTKFCELLSLTKEQFIKYYKKAKIEFPNKESVFLSQVSIEDFSKFQEYLNQFPGYSGVVRTMRQYPYNSAPNLFGYIGEVSDRQIESSDGYYQPGDYAGKFGLELKYDSYLRGTMGIKYYYVDKLGREQGTYEKGEYDQKPVAGKNLISTIDIDLQQYGEKLMKNKRGSIVAIEPKTGEILCLISSPSFDPNLLTGRKRGENYMKLINDPQKPLIDRPLTATYPPGSTFKVFNALVALSDGSITDNYGWTCNMGYHLGGGKVVRCSHPHPSATNLMDGLKYSCNPYFCATFKASVENAIYSSTEAGYLHWRNSMLAFRIGQKTGIDLDGEKSGNVPTPEYYNKIYGKGQWHANTIISLSIGQGEILMTPLQMANGYAAIANRGYFYTPHLIKKVEGDSTGEYKLNYVLQKTNIAYSFYDAVCEGLRRVVESGTAHACAIPSIQMCGKTGTAQNPHGENHSLFAGYAPFNNPQIAIAVIVENGGYGASYAAPIVSLMVEKYINDTIETSRLKMEKRMFDADLLNTGNYGKKQEITE